MTSTAESSQLPDTAHLAARFHALSDEKRLRVLDVLRDGEHCVCDIADALDVGQSLLSFHLKTLKDAGLVSARREGRWMYYSAVPEALDAVGEYLDDLEDQVRSSGSGGEGCAC